ncbi:MAG TPA: TIGR00730 family Rossman fold protein [Candidatus Eisenbacteria bacterium]|nr:TIGR00730 family Rossman fold protein [Candidatus Eisenbacteria bacterium]
MIHKDQKTLERYRKDLVEILAEAEVPPESQIYQEMLYNIAQLKEEKLDVQELRLLNTAFKELRYAMKVFKPYRMIPKAAVFGSARTPKTHPNFKFAAEFGAKLAKKGWMLITGGASGIMEAAMIGAGAENSFGLNILLPFEQSANAVILGNEKLIFFKYFFTRKLMFLKESQATVLFPGGFGTFDEGFESFTLVQTGKAKPRPLIVADPPKSRFWSTMMRYLRLHLESDGLISHGDLELIRHFQDADAAVDELRHFYSNYDSSRFFKDKYLIRVRRPLPAGELGRLGHLFGGILTHGSFERMEDVSEDDVKDPSLERIVFHFDKSSYSRLRLLIDHLNRLP